MSNDKPVNPSRRKILSKILAGSTALAAGTVILSNEEQVLAQKLAEESKSTGTKDVTVDGLSGTPRNRKSISIEKQKIGNLYEVFDLC
ncbi:MAG: hypothetical protein LBU34_15530 [Planctomycetaceae bacterium]|jgi:hypothetical protein|nr:hypothetical protein [Planctomycetaceae bacterium]